VKYPNKDEVKGLCNTKTKRKTEKFTTKGKRDKCSEAKKIMQWGDENSKKARNETKLTVLKHYVGLGGARWETRYQESTEPTGTRESVKKQGFLGKTRVGRKRKENRYHDWPSSTWGLFRGQAKCSEKKDDRGGLGEKRMKKGCGVGPGQCAQKTPPLETR